VDSKTANAIREVMRGLTTKDWTAASSIMMKAGYSEFRATLLDLLEEYPIVKGLTDIAGKEEKQKNEKTAQLCTGAIVMLLHLLRVVERMELEDAG